MRLICIPGSAGKTQGMLPLKGKVLLAFTRLFQLDNQKAETEKKIILRWHKFFWTYLCIHPAGFSHLTQLCFTTRKYT